MSVCIYILFFRFFSIIGYCKILNIVPCAIYTQGTINFVLNLNDGLYLDAFLEYPDI